MITAILLTGIWNSTCTPLQWQSNADDGIQGLSALQAYTFTADGSFTNTVTHFMDENCQVATPDGLYSASGTFNLQATPLSTFSNSASAQEIDLHTTIVSGPDGNLGFARDQIVVDSSTSPISFQMGYGMNSDSLESAMLGMGPMGTIFSKQ
jgi:hypothetical protein